MRDISSPAFDPAQVLAMSGLDYLREMLAGRVPTAPIAATMNIRLHAAEPGRASFRGAPLAQHCNPFGAPHGGWYGTLLDSVLGCAVMTGVPKGAHYTTLEYKVNILRPLALGMEAEAVATLAHAGRRTAVASAELRGIEDGKLYATGSTTCIIMAG
jgi:uncharacterized protein (TIGR00369 family)